MAVIGQQASFCVMHWLSCRVRLQSGCSGVTGRRGRNYFVICFVIKMVSIFFIIITVYAMSFCVIALLPALMDVSFFSHCGKRKKSLFLYYYYLSSPTHVCAIHGDHEF